MAFLVCSQFICVDGAVVHWKWFSPAQLGDIYAASARVTHSTFDRDANHTLTISITKDNIVLDSGGHTAAMSLTSADRMLTRKCIGEYFISNA